MRVLAVMLAVLLIPQAAADPIEPRDSVRAAPLGAFINATLEFVEGLDPNDPPDVILNKTLTFVESTPDWIEETIVCMGEFIPGLNEVFNNPVFLSENNKVVNIRLLSSDNGQMGHRVLSVGIDLGGLHCGPSLITPIGDHIESILIEEGEELFEYVLKLFYL